MRECGKCFEENEDDKEIIDTTHGEENMLSVDILPVSLYLNC